MIPGPEADSTLLDDIAERIRRIDEFTGGKAQTIEDSLLVQDAVLRNLQTLSESTSRLSDAIKDTEPDIPWDDIKKFRNVVTHDYLKVDLDIVRRVIENNLPPLGEAITRMARRVARQLSARRNSPPRPLALMHTPRRRQDVLRERLARGCRS